MNPPDLHQLALRWSRFRFRRDGLQAAAAGLLAGVLPAAWSIPVAVAVTIVVTTAMAWTRRSRWTVRAEDMAAHLDRSEPALEESALLWTRSSDDLTLLERLQLRRLNAAWSELTQVNPRIGQPPANGLRAPSVAAALALVALVAVGRWVQPPVRTDLLTPNPSGPTAAVPVVTRPTVLRAAVTAITPPPYMNRPEREIVGLDGEAEEGSRVRWELQTTEDVATLALVSGAGAQPSIRLEVVGPGRFVGEAQLKTTLLYQLKGTKQDGSAWSPTEIHAVKVIPDRAPRLAFASPVLSRTPLAPENPVVEVAVVATDDHGIGNVHLVATVAKGSGEGVKFRDLELPLAPQTENGVTTWRRTLDARTFELDPGDEVYFHAIAADNREPVAQTARTETRFALMPGAEASVTDPGVSVAGVNLIPEYFRSQRQLIIDTQRLVAARPILPPEVFARHSDAIGVDQKLLRLRYGQFLGEEFEPELSGAPPEPGAAVDEHGHPAAGGVALPGGGAVGGEDERPSLRPEAVDSIQQQFMHNHDKPEAATFFGETVKASLRQVLAAMWEAEGYLRTARPAEALPAENRALELLKELQQADRVYVKRMGFEPPVIRIEERRLRGELEGIPHTAEMGTTTALNKAAEAALREQLSALNEGGDQPSDAARDAQVESALGTAAQADPDRFLPALSVWRKAHAERTEADRGILRKALWSLLPEPSARPQRPRDVRAGLAEAHADALLREWGGSP